MELVQELFVTAFVAIIFSFVVAKLVSIATSTDCEPDLGLKSSDESAPPETTVVEAVRFETGLRVESAKTTKRKVKFVEQVVGKVDEFEVKRFDSDVLGQPEKSPGIEIASVKEIKIDDDSVKVRDVMERGQNSNLDGLVVETADVEEIDENKIVENAKNDSEEVRDAVERGQNSNLDRIEVGLKEGLSGDDEEDWEGVERSELEEVFAVASNYVASRGKDDRLFKEGSDVQMKLYGLHKVAMEGPCYESQPLAFKVSARAKWNAWQKLGNMSPEVAMEQYITLLSDKDPGWMEGKSSGDANADYLESGIPDAPTTYPQNQLSSTENSGRELELKSATDGGNLTGSSNSGTKTNNDKQ